MTAGRKRICCCASVPLFSPSNYFPGNAREKKKEEKKKEDKKRTDEFSHQEQKCGNIIDLCSLIERSTVAVGLKFSTSSVSIGGFSSSSSFLWDLATNIIYSLQAAVQISQPATQPALLCFHRGG